MQVYVDKAQDGLVLESSHSCSSVCGERGFGHDPQLHISYIFRGPIILFSRKRLGRETVLRKPCAKEIPAGLVQSNGHQRLEIFCFHFTDGILASGQLPQNHAVRKRAGTTFRQSASKIPESTQLRIRLRRHPKFHPGMEPWGSGVPLGVILAPELAGNIHAGTLTDRRLRGDADSGFKPDIGFRCG